MEYTRDLQRGMTGEDVKHIKDRLVHLGYLHASTHSTFGNDTAKAVERFQRAQGFVGVVDERTWDAIEKAVENAAEPGMAVIPPNIGPDARARIANDLSGCNAVRRGIALDALQFAYDSDVPAKRPLSFYIRGGNLYGTDLSLNVMTEAKLNAYFAKDAYAQYFDGGRKEMMQAAAVAAGFTISGADCSGGVVGLLRHAGVVNSNFDMAADGFYAASTNYPQTERDAMHPGDLLHRSGHIGMYVGGGYAVEWIGGAYGCQLTKVDDRRAFNFLTGKTSKMGAWTGFLRPTYY